MINRVFRVFGVLILVAAVTGGGYWFWQQRTATTSTGSATEVYTQIVTVSEGSISATVSVVGQLSAPQSQEMTFERLDGTTSLMSLLVAAGNDVQAGQVLAEIDPTPYEQALDQMARRGEAEGTDVLQMTTCRRGDGCPIWVETQGPVLVGPGDRATVVGAVAGAHAYRTAGGEAKSVPRLVDAVLLP